LRCPSCPTTSKAIHPAVGTGFLKLDDFRKLLDDNPGINEIELSNFGEIFLNPHLLEIIRLAHERDVALQADNGVNFNHVKDNVLEGLVKYQFRSMTCSIDGASNATYGIYRVNGNFDTVIENVRKLNDYKTKYRSPYPHLAWQFVLFGHNEHEILVAKNLADELGMKFIPKLSWEPAFSPARDQALVRREVGAASREEYRQQHGVDYKQAICHQLWDSPQINWDGKVLGCCRNFWGDFGGNAFDDGLVNSINNAKIQYARRMLLGNESPRADIPCTTCDIYLTMQANRRWLHRGWLFKARAAVRAVYRRLGLHHSIAFHKLRQRRADGCGGW
jgi:MoaA/NifB/PqqE/SkfB family radical SAM enzyme